MKKYFYLLFACFIVSVSAKAAPGDTTWVQANVDSLEGYGDYDSTVTFPSGATTYRNVYMIFTLGKHVCPGYFYRCNEPGAPPCGAGQIPWCADWDYTIQNFLMTPSGDTMELGRLITPYANASNSNPRTPYGWTQRYVYDVTDYVSKLNGSATMRIHYSGYSGGFFADIKFAFVEGTPDRTVKGIEHVWNRALDGSFTYGVTPGINTHFAALTKTPPAGTVSTDLKFTVTGHGSDGNGCCEFLNNIHYQVMLNSSSIATKEIWRDNCGSNELYPQSGTWIYDRGNWCPGAIIYSDVYTLPGVAAGSPYNIALQFDSYAGVPNSSGGYGSYTTDATLINYGGFNKPVDAGIIDVIAPNNNENHYRENPITGSPIIRIKNRGAATMTSATIQYGLQDSALSSYDWTGSLAPQAEADVVLPELPALDNVAGVSGLFTFNVKIISVNGAADADNTNDVMSSQFVSGPVWPSPFRIQLKTNNEVSQITGTTSETEWKIYNMNNVVVASRTSNAISTTYLDTISTLYTGAYKLVITDDGCNGLDFWANPSSTTVGTFGVRQYVSNAAITMANYPTGGNAGNFGCSFEQYFYVKRDFPAGVNDLSSFPIAINAYPNPAQDIVNVDFSGVDRIQGTIQLIDALGRVAVTMPCSNAHQQISLNGLSTGVYTIQFINAAGNTLKTRLLITK